MPAASSPPPVVQDRYRLVEWLGQGSMGVVYRARDEKLDRAVVIKFRQPGSGDSARFLREARSVARLSHPNIMAIYDTGHQSGWDFLVLEYVPGKDLHALQMQRSRLLVEDVMRIAEAIVNALAFAHQNGIIHRDIKPENIKVTPEGMVKLMDFSLAFAQGDERLTQTGTVVGTTLYLAPECLQGSSSDARSDLYSLGVVMYELLTGQPPFRGESPIVLISNILHQNPDHPSILNNEVPNGLGNVVMRLLARRPDERFSSAEDVLTALKSLEDNPQALQPAAPAVTSASIAAVEAERRRMAGLLDTRVVEPVNLLISQSSAFEQTLAAHQGARAALSVITALARQVLQQVRDLGEGLHPAVLETLGLEPALEVLKGQAERTTGLLVTLNLARLPERLPHSLEIGVFRLAQQALEAIPELQATRAELRLAREGDCLLLDISWPASVSFSKRLVDALRQQAAPLKGEIETTYTGGQSHLRARYALRAAAEFTGREMEVLQCLVEGLSNKEIAGRLHISPRTVNFHLDNIYAKIGVSTRTEAAVLALRQGWVRRPSDITPVK